MNPISSSSASAGWSFSLSLRGGVVLTQPDVLAGEGPQVEVEPRAVVEPLVEKAVHLLGGGDLEVEVVGQVEPLDVPRDEAREELVGEPAGGEGEFPLPTWASRGRTPTAVG